MSIRTTQPELSATTAVLRNRCKELALPTWILSEHGEVLLRPSGWGPAEQWLQAPLLAEWISQAAVAPRAASFVSLFRGCWLVSLKTSNHPRKIIATLITSSEALRSDQFEAICSHGKLDSSISRTALAPLARWQRSDCDRLGRILRWMHEDAMEAGEHREAIGVFTEQLSSAFEQITLLYDLSRSINRIEEPDKFVQLACHRLQEVLDFRWVVIRLDLPDRTRGLAEGGLVLAGNLPCARRQLLAEISRLEHEGDCRRASLLENQTHPLAALTRGDVLVAPIVCGEDVVGQLLAGGREGRDHDVSSTDFHMLRATAEYVGSFLHSVAAFQEQRSIFLGTVRAITYTIEAKDRYTRGHSERVAHLGAQLATAFGIDHAEVARIRLAGMLHDVGKIGVPETVLRKPGGLTDDEYEAIKRHPVIGYTILRDIGPLHDILPGVLHHHERWDGGGYPQGLAGPTIPLMARILAVADTFDAMCSDRSYRSGRPRRKVVEEIARMSGTQLDPDLAEAFLKLDLTGYDHMIASHMANDGARDEATA